MGGLVTAAGVAMPRLPRSVSVPLAVGCWTNALAFAPPAVQPAIEKAQLYRALVAASSRPPPPVGLPSPERRSTAGPRPAG